MITEFIPKTCWCGEIDYRVFAEDTHFDNTKFILGECKNCKTIRTIYSSAKEIVEYNETVVYSSGLGLRHRNSLTTIARNIQNGTLLDIGCSSGEIINEILKKKKHIKVEGIDLNRNAIDNPVSKNISIEYMDIKDLKKKYNNIIALHVLEHIPDLAIFFNEVRRISEESVTYYFVSPNINSYSARHQLTRWGALNPNQHSWHFSKETFVAMLLHFLPECKVIVAKTSWVWPYKLFFYRNILFQGDQVEVVLSKNK